MRRPFIAGTAVAAIFMIAFWELAEGLAGSSRLIDFDAALSSTIQSWRSPGLTAAMIAITNAGDSPAVALAAVGIFIAFSALRHYRMAGFAGGIVLLGAVFSSVAKRSFARPRPPLEQALIDLPGSYSFPSGHTIGSMTFAFVMGYLVARAPWHPAARIAVVGMWALYAILVGVSRIYLGVHWPSDVLAAWLIGGALASFSLGVWASWFSGATRG